MSYILEVCADSVQSAVAAQEGGADRIELCSGLVIGGLSPSPALFKQIRKYTDLKIRTLLRPRFGDFCYDDYEFQTLKEEVEMFRELGADGVVIGMLNPDGTLDMERMEVLVNAAGDIGITLHRAFDVCRDPYEALEQCVSLGIDTILTSGQKNSAWEGRGLLAELAEQAAGRVEILAGAGVNPGVIEKLAGCTTVRAFHMSGKKVMDSRMEFRREGVPMGIPGFSEFEIWQTDREQVRRAVQVLQSLPEEA
jgi:copper homeostasis protein